LKDVVEGVPPDGFESWEDYLANKCKVANGVFDGWLAALRNLSVITLVQITSLGVLVGLGIPAIISFPPVAIAVMIGLMIALAGFYVAFGQIADGLEENRSQIICDLYHSDTVQSQTAVLADALDSVIALISVSTKIGALLKSAALLLVNGDTLNQLQSGIADYAYPNADCSYCDEAMAVFQAMSNGGAKCTQLNDNDFESVWRSDANRWEVTVAANHESTDDSSFTNWVGPEVSFELNVIGGQFTPITPPPNGWRLVNQAGDIIYDSPYSPSGPVVAGWCNICSATAFTLRITAE
jgi:hypothetical protein